MTYVTLQPNSITNPHDHHAVVDYDEWSAYTAGARLSFKVHSAHGSAAEARIRADALNAEELCKNGCRAAADELVRLGQELTDGRA